jgi:serine protease
MPSCRTNSGNIGLVITCLRALPTLLLALCCAVPLTTTAAAATPASTQRIIIKWRDTADARPSAATPQKITALRSRNLPSLTRGWNIGGSLSVLQLDTAQSGARLTATLAALRSDPEIELAVPDERVKAQAYTPNDEKYPAQWYLQSVQVSATRANQAWDITRGSPSVIVAVLDTGVRFDHPDLAGKLLPGWDFVSTALVGNDGDGWDDDPTDPGDYLTPEDQALADFTDCDVTNSTWHGTRVSGLIAAASDNGTGIAGSGFNVRILPVRVLGKCGGFVSDVIAGMYWAAGMAPPPPYLSFPLPPVNTNPARIINMSLGTDNACTESNSEVYRVAVSQVTANGSLIVASTGNSGAAVGTPASCDGVLAVAGLRHAGTKVGYSNLGPEVDVAAPAGNCVLVGPGDPCLFALDTTTNLGTQGPGINDYSSQLSQPTLGTSFSTPLVSGTAALMLSVSPNLTPAQLTSLIRSSARPFPTVSDNNPQPPACVSPTVTPVQGTECICNTQFCGAGMLDTHAAVLAAGGLQPPPPPPDDDGGGGSGEGLILPALLLWLVRAHRRQPATL